MANERKNKNRSEFLERIRKDVMTMGVIELTLKNGGITAEQLAEEFRSFHVNKMPNGQVFVALKK